MRLDQLTISSTPPADTDVIPTVENVSTTHNHKSKTVATFTASATSKGFVELATSAETITGTDDVRAVTPADLQAKVTSDTVKGIVELATVAETSTGTDATRAVTPDALAGSNLGIRYTAVALNGSVALTTSDVAYFRIPAGLTGMNLISVTGEVGTGAAGSSSSGNPTFTVTNVTDGTAMLSTALTIDATEYTSASAATPVVIDTTKDDVVTDDLIKVAVTTSGTGTTFAVVTLGFALP